MPVRGGPPVTATPASPAGTRFAEQKTIGAALARPGNLPVLRALVTPADFTNEVRAQIWETICEITDEGRGLDAVVIADLVNARVQSDVTRDAIVDELITCRETAKVSRSLEEAPRELRRASEARELEDVGRQLQDAAKARDAADLPALASDLVSGFSQRFAETSAPAKFDGVALELWRKLNDKTEAMRVLTRTKGIDRVAGGLIKTGFYILATRPSFGKTTFGMHLLKRFAQGGGPCGIISLEMKRDELAGVTAASVTKTDSRYWSGELAIPEGKREEMMEALSKSMHLPIHIVDKIPRPTITNVVAAIHQLRSIGCRLIVLDYLQLMVGESRKQSRVEAISEISRGLKLCASEIEIPIVALCQLNREIEKEKVQRKPRMSDLRECGSLEQDADGVWFLWPAGEEDPSTTVQPTEFIVAKNRGGRTGFVTYEWNKRLRYYPEF